MAQCHERMAVQHARTGIAHDFSYAVPHFRLVAVNRAIATCRFFFLKWTEPQSFSGILEKLGALQAKFYAGFMVSIAIDRDHRLDGFQFSCKAWLREVMIDKTFSHLIRVRLGNACYFLDNVIADLLL